MNDGFFTEKALRELNTQKSLITTQRARDILKLSEQQWCRRKSQPHFPNLIRHGRVWLVEPQELLTYVHHENALHAGLSFTKVSARVHRTIATLRRMIEAGSFPAPIGCIGGRDRFDLKAIEHWEQAQRKSLPLPPELQHPPASRRMRNAVKRRRSPQHRRGGRSP